jgi:hypothetical protein
MNRKGNKKHHISDITFLMYTAGYQLGKPLP